MNDPQTFEGMPDPDSSIHSQYSKLAVWLQQKREEMRRLQQLEARQSGLFDPDSSDKP